MTTGLKTGINALVFLGTLFLLSCTITNPVQTRMEREVSETLLAGIDIHMNIMDSLVVSPDGRQFACAGESGVVLGGREGIKCEGGKLESFTFSPDSKHFAFIAAEDKELTRCFAVLDGVESKRYDDIDNLVFSPNSKRLAYVAIDMKGQDDREQSFEEREEFVVVDEKEGKRYDRTGAGFYVFTPYGKRVWSHATSLAFSPDSEHLAYTARRGDEWFVVVDGKEHKQYEAVKNDLLFSPDSKHFAYKAYKDDKCFVVLDNKELRAFDRIGFMYFSPDSTRFAYFAGTRKEGLEEEAGEEKGTDLLDYWLEWEDDDCFDWVVVVDGKTSDTYYDIKGFRFSPDSSRIAYAAAREPEGGIADKVYYRRVWLMIVDGKEEKEYDEVSFPVFSPDGKQVSYVADTWIVVQDGKECKTHGWVPPYSLVFSPDSSRLAYVCKEEDLKQRAVVDGQKQEQFRVVYRPEFSPDSRHVAYVAHTYHEDFVVVDGEAGKKKYCPILGPIVWTANDKFHYIVMHDDGAIYLVEERLKEK